MLFAACKGQNKEANTEVETKSTTEYTSIGAAIDENGAILSDEMTSRFQNLIVSDTLKTKFSATVTEVCQSKGCWMKLKLENGIKSAQCMKKDSQMIIELMLQGSKGIRQW